MNVHRKTYFKTIENRLQNENNKTRRKFANELETVNKRNLSLGQSLIEKVKDMQSALADPKDYASILTPLSLHTSNVEEVEDGKDKGANHEPQTLKKVLINCNYKWDP